VSVARLPDCIPAPRLTLRRWLPDDGPDLAAAVLQNLDHLRPWMPWIQVEPQTPEDRLALINTWQADWEDGGDMVIGAFLEGEVIGSAGLHRRRGPRVLEIGYWVHVDHIGRGYATEIAEALTTAAFTVAEIERVEIHHDKANVASGGVPRRLGYTFVDETPDSVTSPGEVGVDCRWLITRDQWAGRSAERER
jgi:RimJ/RimL family protein N-acetyltransferase